MTLEHDHDAHEPGEPSMTTLTMPGTIRGITPAMTTPHTATTTTPAMSTSTTRRRSSCFGPTRTITSATPTTARSRTTSATAFTGLPYFPVDEALRLEGLILEPYEGDEPTSFQIPTSDGQLRDAERAGTFRFEIGGESLRLTGYRFAAGGSESVFVPFLDGTSGQESYGAGRYLDLDPDARDGTYVLGLQPGLPPVLCLRPPLLVPADAAREPIAGPYRGRRAPARSSLIGAPWGRGFLRGSMPLGLEAAGTPI